MSGKDAKMYSELLEILEKRYENGEIDKESYLELKERYSAKYEEAKLTKEELKDAPRVIKSAGSQSISDTLMSFSGASKISGGKVDRDIRISGAGKIDGDLECNSFRSSGASKVGGDLIARGPIKTSGSFKVAGKVQCDADISASGSINVENELTTKGEINVSGSIFVGDNVQAEEGIKASGSNELKGNVVSRKTIELSGKSSVVGDLIGENILISGKRSVFALVFGKGRESSEVNGNIFAHKKVDIEDVYIDGDVKGVLVKLGPNTHVHGTVYYVDDLLVTEGVKMDNEPIQISASDLKL